MKSNLGTIIQEDFGDAKEKKDVFLKLVQRNHRILEVPVTISSGKIIMDVIEVGNKSVKHELKNTYF